MTKFRPLLLFGLLLVPADAGADPIQIPLPLNSPVGIDLTVNPIVTFGTRTIDFTSSLNQEFIAFLIAATPVGMDYRNTIGVRARDGLLQLSGMFPLSPDPTFVNQLPTFTQGTMNLLAFDLVIPDCCTKFSVSLIDLNGDSHTANFSNPVPEPATFFLAASGLALLAKKRRRNHA
jgi:PEP-CTERM motif-containing protein